MISLVVGPVNPVGIRWPPMFSTVGAEAVSARAGMLRGENSWRAHGAGAIRLGDWMSGAGFISWLKEGTMANHEFIDW